MRTNTSTPVMCTRTNPENNATIFSGLTKIKHNAKPALTDTSFNTWPVYNSLTIFCAALAPRYLKTRLANNAPGKAESKPPISKEYALIQPDSINTASEAANININW
ncbi:MAG: hypothetical protein Q8M35_06370 [Pseudohongiella sp.]|nr:hypothetical protein [Pseudohongiella sp.]